MFKLRFVTCVIGLLTYHCSPAQHNAALKAQTFRVFNGLYTFSYEQALSKHFSAQVSLETGHYIKMRPNRVEDYEAKGLGLIGAVRYYPLTQKFAAPQGFFTYIAFRNIRFRDTYRATGTVGRYDGSGNVLSMGGGAGYKFVYHRFALEGFIGWGAGKLMRDDEALVMPQFFRTSMNEEAHFPQLDIAVCYMLTSFSKGQ